MTEFWTIEEADVGGMLGGYPRWLDKQGSYGAMVPNEFMKFGTREELEQSKYWERVKEYKDYKIVHYSWQVWRPLTPEEKEHKLKEIEKLFFEVENGYCHWTEVK